MKIISFFPVESPAVAGAEEEDFELNEDANSFDEMVCDVTIQINFGRHLCNLCFDYYLHLWGQFLLTYFAKPFFKTPLNCTLNLDDPKVKLFRFSMACD